jgi:hypothetical protein
VGSIPIVSVMNERAEILRSGLEYLCDNARHLICLPYSIENLHRMASELGIKRCWFHKDHYDIPKSRISEIVAKCRVVSSKEIVKIVRKID